MRLTSYLLLATSLVASPAFAQEPTDGAAVVANVVKAAEEMLATFDDARRKEVQFDFSDDRQRKNWSNLPTGIVKRSGVRWGDLDEEQRSAVMAMLAATLSDVAMRQIAENMEGDEVLRREAATRGGAGPGQGAQRGGGPAFGEEEYYLAILGKPSTTEPWMWQFGGHHLAFNATIFKDGVTLSPTLTGGQPMTYEIDGRKVEQMVEERAAAAKFVESLKPEQLKVAILSDRPGQLEFGPGADDAKPKGEGLRAKDLDDAQRELLFALIEERVRLLDRVHADARMAEIRNDVDRTWIAWYGPANSSGAASYRIQSPSVVIEYVPQQSRESGAAHVHAMYRDPKNDYGAAWKPERR